MEDLKIWYTAEDVQTSLANTPQITLELTDACNLKCEYCGYGKFYGNHDRRENNTLKFDYVRRFLDYLYGLWQSPFNKSAYNRLTISFYGGEPLLNMPLIRKIVDFIEQSDYRKFRNICFNMTTNAMLLDRYMDYLVKKDIQLLISLDGNKDNMSYRVNNAGENVFDKIVAHVDLLKEKYPVFFETKVNFNAVLHNCNSIDSIYSFFKTRYNKTPAIVALNNTGIKDDMKAEFDRTYKNVKESLIQSENYTQIEQDMFMDAPTYRSVALFLFNQSEFSYRNYNELLYGKPDKKDMIPTGTCVPFGKKVFITVNGKILPCERIGHQYTLGQIKPESIELDFNYIANRYNGYLNKIQRLCVNCYSRTSCYQCIFNLDTLDETCPVCFGYMNQKTFEQYRKTQLSFFYTRPEAYAKIMNEVVIK
jgi:uncharacterized protein